MRWLLNAVQRAGLPAAEDASLKAGMTNAGAWEMIARVAGMKPEELVPAVAPGLRLGVANLEGIDSRASRLVPEKLARRSNVVPLRDDDRNVYVATADPMDLNVEQALEFASGRRVVFELAAPEAITRSINAVYSPNFMVETVLGAIADSAADTIKVIEEEQPEQVSVREADAAPVVKLTNVILRDAIVQDASDIHIEPGQGGGTVRFRIDGMMRVHLQLPMQVVTRVVSRIKVLSRLDIADRLRPQDGRARIQVEGKQYDLRISTVPTRDAEKAVIRILRPLTSKTLDNVGIPAQEIARLRQLLNNRDGIVAITGPTGSGKTTTIYGAIREIATGDVNLVTVEDPVEYELGGVTQIQVDPRRGVSFASALRAILRQDPDVIFIGEIRDLETAEIATQAAMTGHLVLATVHANDALGSVARLHDLGLDLNAISATLRGSIAQRLVRKLCSECAVPATAPYSADEERLIAQYGTKPAKRAVGCPACANSGYRGRIPVAEVAVVSPSIAEQIAAGANAVALNRAAVAGGMRPLRDAALARVVTGETSLQEVERVLGDTEGDPEEAETAAPAPAPAAATPPVVIAPPSVSTKPAASGAPASILLVEDDPVERRLARAVLEAGGYKVVEATDGKQALTQLSSGQRFGLVVTDLQMEHMDGATLVREIRRSVDGSVLPIIVLTGSDDPQTESDLLDAGADDYVRKPFDPPRFNARIKAALRRVAAE